MRRTEFAAFDRHDLDHGLLDDIGRLGDDARRH